MVKKQLQALGRFLGKSAGKAAVTLPGIIGSVTYWLFNFLSKSVGWLANNLWEFLITLGSIILIYARDFWGK